MGGLIIQLNDYVLISTEGAMDADSENEAYLAQVLDLYDSGKYIFLECYKFYNVQP